MTNWTLINEATKEVSKLYEAERIMETEASIRKRVLDWYNHTDITELELLVAAAWLGGYHEAIEYDVIVATREMLYPQMPIEMYNFHVSEYEMALADMKWM